MKKKSLLLLTVAVLSIATFTLKTHGGREPAEYPDIVGPEHSTGCPGVGTCTRTVTPGNYYCDTCWWYECGCDCTPADLLQSHEEADCAIVKIGPLTFAFCVGWHSVSYTWVPATVCTSWPN